MPRFFCDDIEFNKKTIRITNSAEIHHLKDVLRLKCGDKIQVFNMFRQEADALIETVSSHSVDLTLLEVKKAALGEEHEIILACAIPKRAKFEWIIEKCTELGVSEIIPLKTERTELTLNEERLLRKSERYRKVAINAAKQSRRTSVPVIHPVTRFADVLRTVPLDAAIFIPSLLGERKPVKSFLSYVMPNQKIVMFIGPEGDFTESEVASALARGAIPLTLGPTTLKVDTAAILVVGIAQMLSNS